jgi:pSer/pThr/pTyr-binding forkhead associated (FHA) protein
LVPLYHPRNQQWSDHFAWNEDFSLIIGLTATGRATVETLQINREGVVNLRRVLYTMGEHPPVEENE